MGGIKKLHTLNKKISQRALEYDLIAYGIDLDNGIISNEDLGIYFEDEIDIESEEEEDEYIF